MSYLEIKYPDGRIEVLGDMDQYRRDRGVPVSGKTQADLDLIDEMGR